MSPDGLASASARAVSAANSPTLVVLPGLDGTDVFSRPFLAGLPGTFTTRVVCYPAAGPHSYEDLLPHVLAAISDLDDFYLFGASFGGPLAVMLAAAQPSRVRGLVLSATFLRAPLPRLVPFRFALSGPLIWALTAARRIPIWLKDTADPLRVAKAETWSRTPAGALAARARAALAVDAREALSRVRAPVLSVAFADDRTIPALSTGEIAQLCPSARTVTLPGGHLAMFSDPAPLVAAVAGFIRP